MITGQEAILSLGKTLYGEKFELKENLIEPYRKVFENFTYSLGDGYCKGVALIGAKGLSKSSIMRIIHILFKDTGRRFVSTTSQKLYLTLDAGEKLTKILDDYTVYCPSDLYIDDIGVKKEDIKKDYGNTISLLSELLNLRYEMFVSSGARTHVSSNLPTRLNKAKIIESHIDWSEQKKEDLKNVITLEDVYGERIVDRLIEINDVIKFKGESLR